jgi:pyruvate, water dikinase
MAPDAPKRSGADPAKPGRPSSSRLLLGGPDMAPDAPNPRRARREPRPGSTVLSLSDAAATRVAVTGGKAAALARMLRAGLPVPAGVCVPASVYRAHLAAAGLEALARDVASSASDPARAALRVRLGLLEVPIDVALDRALEDAIEALAPGGALLAVRSSALGEARARASFPGQLETVLGVEGPTELRAALRACWASLWTGRAVRYAAAHGIDLARGAVAVLVQRLLPARAAGGALSRSADDRVVVTGAWGLGPAVADGGVVPDRWVFNRAPLSLVRVEPGRKTLRLAGSPGVGTHWEQVPRELVTTPCLDEREAREVARLAVEAENVFRAPVEIEWAIDERVHVLQARRLRGTPASGTPPEPGTTRLAGQPAGAGRASGRARVVMDEHDLVLVGRGEVLVTRVPGPALAAVLPLVAGLVTERGGSTSHIAALARERRLPAVLGVVDATRLVPEGAMVTVDGDAGVIDWREDWCHRFVL